MKRVILILVLLLAREAGAATYYVEKSGSGTSPYDTLAKASTTIQNVFDTIDLEPGDIVEVCAATPGATATYTEMVSILVADTGSAVAPVVLRGRSGDTIVIDGESARTACIVFQGTDCAYFTIENFTLQNPTTTGCIHAGGSTTETHNGFTIRNVTTSGGAYGIRVRAKSNCTLENVTISGATSSGVLFEQFGALTMTGNSFTNVTISGCATGCGIADQSNLTVSGLTVTGCTNAGTYAVSFEMDTGTLALTNPIIGTQAAANAGKGLVIGGVCALTMTNPTCEYNSAGGLRLSGLTLSSCNITGGTFSNNPSAGGDGIRLTNCTGAVISNSTIADNGSCGVRIETASAGNTIETSTISGNPADGVGIWGTGSDDNIVQYNIITDNGSLTPAVDGTGDAFTAHDDSAGNICRYNLMYYNRNTGIAVIETSRGYVYNNVIYQNGNHAPAAASNRGGYYNTCTSGTGTWVVRNNIFSGNYPYEVYCSAAGWTATDINYNQYLHTGNGVTEATFATLDGGGTDITWATYATNEANSAYGNPLLVNPTTDFHLQAGSPCINTGTDLGDGASYLDYDGLNQDNYGSAWDIGAYVAPYRGGGSKVLPALTSLH